MTTIERRQPRGLRVSPLELRLYVATLLAAAYAITWRAISSDAPAVERSPATTPANDSQHVVWIDSLPPGMRPAVVLPPGWQLVSEPRASLAPPERVVRVPGRRIPRVRTRSS